MKSCLDFTIDPDYLTWETAKLLLREKGRSEEDYKKARVALAGFAKIYIRNCSESIKQINYSLNNTNMSHYDFVRLSDNKDSYEETIRQCEKYI